MRGIVLPAELEEWIEPLCDEERGRLLTAVLAYAKRGERVEMTGGERYVFPVTRKFLDAERLHEEAVSRARSEAGKRGGRPPKGEKAKKANAFSKKQKKQMLSGKDEDDCRESAGVPASGEEAKGESSAAGEEAKYRIPLLGGEAFEVTERFISHQQELFPAVDVEGEIRKMVGWCESQPKKRKTPSGIHRFINSWLSRAQDLGGTYAAAKTPARAQTDKRTPYRNELLEYAVRLEQEEGGIGHDKN